MKLYLIPLIALCLATSACSDSDEPLQGWKESDVEIVNEGTAPGTAQQVVLPGDATTTPMTGTNFDTTTDLDMITDEQLGLESDSTTRQDGEQRAGSIAGRREATTITTMDTRDRTTARTTTEPRPEPEPSPSSSRATSTTSQSPAPPRPAETAPEPEPKPKLEPETAPKPDKPAPEAKPEEEDGEEAPEEEHDVQQEEILPPIVIPAPEPPNSKPQNDDSDTLIGTADRSAG